MAPTNWTFEFKKFAWSFQWENMWNAFMTSDNKKLWWLLSKKTTLNIDSKRKYDSNN
jgi:hypothetical protein